MELYKHVEAQRVIGFGYLCLPIACAERVRRIFVVAVQCCCLFRNVVSLRIAREAFFGKKGIADGNGKVRFHMRYKGVRTVGMLQGGLVDSGPSDYKNMLYSGRLETAPRQRLFKCADRDRAGRATFNQ